MCSACLLQQLHKREQKNLWLMSVIKGFLNLCFIPHPLMQNHQKISPNWDLFNTLCTDKLVPENFKESSDSITDFTSSLNEISKECIPQTSTNPTKSNPWYNDDCKEAIKQCKQAVSKFKRSPNTNNFNDIKVFRAKARRTIKLSKHKSWRSYVSKISHKTPIKKVWDMIRKIGKKQIPQLHTFKHGGY